LTPLLSGCLPALPDNTKVPFPEYSLVAEAAGAVLREEPDLDGAYWLEVPYADGSGAVGGYLSSDLSPRASIVIMLHGASSFQPQGRLATARSWHQELGETFRQAGYRTLSLVYTECGTAYGQRDLEELYHVIDWLHNGGNAALGVDRIYLFGYSTGATLVNLASLRGRFTAGVSIAGLTEPDAVEESWAFYNLAGLIYPGNEGMCQAATTVNTYGPPGSAGWDALDTVAHVSEIKAPLLVVQGTADEVYGIDNSIHLELAYQQAVRANPELPPVEFLRFEGVDHAASVTEPSLVPTALAFFERFGR
jgi:dienelactone hydrolase